MAWRAAPAAGPPVRKAPQANLRQHGPLVNPAMTALNPASRLHS
jgi:hypothetical protein